jgi:hypothetical protein
MTTPHPISGQQQLIASAADYSAILGGQQNTIATGFQHSAIAGGCGNTINANCASILGGCGNTVNNDYTAVFGVGITTTLVPGPSSIWADELVIPNIPIGILFGGIPTPPIGYPTGSLWYYPDTNGNNVVYVV